jgi:1-acyl-sn-glycerol-3-phosphate acyltransferase
VNGFWVGLGAATVVLAALLFWLLHIGRRAQVAEWDNAFLNSMDGLCRIFCARFHGLVYEPIQVPASGGAIVASNHLSGLDPLLLTCACAKPLRYMIATEQFERPLFKWLYSAMGSIPVDRTGAPEKAFYAAMNALERGELIAVFPQGKITRPDEDVPLKRGVILLADLAHAPIIPVRLSGIKGTGRVVTAIFMRSKARLETGPAIRVSGPRDDGAKEVLRSFICAPPGGAAAPTDGGASEL